MKYQLKDVSFYITNVCNLSCENCATYNNYRLKGHYKYEDSAEHIEQWSRLLDMEHLHIHGGEPFSNPDLPNWTWNIRRLWPRRYIKITTNGTLISQHVDFIKQCILQKIVIEIAVHDPQMWEGIEQNVLSILSGTEYTVFEDINTDSERGELENYYSYVKRFVNPLGKDMFTMEHAYEFMPSSIERIEDSVIYMRRSNQEIAHNNCPISDCNYVINGRLYKCKTTAMSDILHRNFKVNDDCQQILNASKSVLPSDLDVIEFLQNLDQSIEQCKLCPESPVNTMTKIYPLNPKKPYLPRIA
jgi:MoaA/NifB/PqqE/SkfB family radical SAM enzyme